MAEVGLLSTGLRLTAFLKPCGPGNASAAYEKLCRLERTMLDLLAEAEPDADGGDWFELSLRRLNQRLLDEVIQLQQGLAVFRQASSPTPRRRWTQRSSTCGRRSPSVAASRRSATACGS